jgi:hypothetical protein
MKYLFFISVLLIIVNFPAFSQTRMIINKYNGSADSINFADIKSITFDANLIRNGSFDNSLQNWILIGDKTNPYHPEDPGRADFSINNGTLEINITNQGISIWSIMLYQKVTFAKGAVYKITFSAKADSDMQIISNVAQDGGEWTVYSGDKKFTINSTMASYSYQFTMPVNGSALFQFCLGTAGKRKIYIDNIELRKL